VVTFSERGTCVPYEGDVTEAQARARLLERFGREIDHSKHQNTLQDIGIPTGNKRLTTSRRWPGNFAVDPRTARNLSRFNPAGLIEIDAAEVISPAPVQRYDVLPQEAGLLQLIAEGALRRMPMSYLLRNIAPADRSDRRRMFPHAGGGVYLIERPIKRFPAGLNGAHLVTFVLGSDVPLPAGNAGHSTVIREGTGECISGPLCRRVRSGWQ
jgi:hypothetical protein